MCLTGDGHSTNNFKIPTSIGGNVCLSLPALKSSCPSRSVEDIQSFALVYSSGASWHVYKGPCSLNLWESISQSQTTWISRYNLHAIALSEQLRVGPRSFRQLGQLSFDLQVLELFRGREFGFHWEGVACGISNWSRPLGWNLRSFSFSSW